MNIHTNRIKLIAKSGQSPLIDYRIDSFEYGIIESKAATKNYILTREDAIF